MVSRIHTSPTEPEPDWKLPEAGHRGRNGNYSFLSTGFPVGVTKMLWNYTELVVAHSVKYAHKNGYFYVR